MRTLNPRFWPENRSFNLRQDAYFRNQLFNISRLQRSDPEQNITPIFAISYSTSVACRGPTRTQANTSPEHKPPVRTLTYTGGMSRLPALSALRAFEASARLGSHRRASEELFIDHTVVSKHIRKLEAELGVQLLDVAPSGTRLTAAGQAYYREISVALAAISAATERVRQAPGSLQLHVSCSPGFAVRWLAPRISRFIEAHPGLELSLRPTTRPPDLAHDDADVDVRYGAQCARSDRQQVLLVPRVYPVASPAWLAAHGAINTPHDLLQAALVHEETHDHWKLWLEHAGVTVAVALHGPRYWSAALALDAARMGQGIALANDCLVADELKSGELVEILTTDILIHPYTIRTQKRRWSHPLISEFRAWLVGHFLPHRRQ